MPTELLPRSFPLCPGLYFSHAQRDSLKHFYKPKGHLYPKKTLA